MHLRKCPQIHAGDSNGLETFSDFLGQCEEAMKSMEFMNDLDSTEVMNQVSSKLPSYSGVKWCRHAFGIKKKHGRAVLFHDLVKFVESEADLATDPVFSPDSLKAEYRKGPDKNKGNFNRRRPPSSNSFVTSTGHTQCNGRSASEPRVPLQTRSCPLCSNSHALYSCDEFKKKNMDERHALFG